MEAGGDVTGSHVEVRSVSRALGLLAHVRLSGTSLTELAASAGLPLPTTARLLATIEGHDYLTRRDDGRYVPGPALYRLVFDLDPATLLRDTVAGQVRRLRDASGETSGFFVRDGFERFCVETAPSPRPLRRTFPLLTRRAIQVGATGKILVAYAETDRIVDALLESADAERRRGLEALRTECVEIRRRGWAYSDGVVDEAWGVAAPVFTGRVLLGALSIAAPVDRGGPDAVAAQAEICVRHAQDLTDTLTDSLPGGRSTGGGRPPASDPAIWAANGGARG